MTTTVLRTVPCAACGHRIGVHHDTCPYCGERARAKHRRPVTPIVACATGRCAMCGGRMTRARSRIAKLLAKLGLRMRRAKHLHLACSSCGYRVPA